MSIHMISTHFDIEEENCYAFYYIFILWIIFIIEIFILASEFPWFEQKGYFAIAKKILTKGVLVNILRDNMIMTNHGIIA